MSEELIRQVEELTAKVEELKQMLMMQKASVSEMLARRTTEVAPQQVWDKDAKNIGGIQGTISDWKH